MRYVARRSAVVVTTIVTVALLGACKAPALPGGPGEPDPTPSPTDSPTDGPTDPGEEPTSEPTDDPTTVPVGPGGSEGVDVSVTIEPGFSMPNVVEASLNQARRTLEREGAETVTVVDARRGDEVRGQANGWAVCSQEPVAGDFTRASSPVVLTAAPNARQCR